MKLDAARTITVVQLRMALACILLAILGGAMAVLHYIPSLSPDLHEAGLGLTKMRPLHTTFASVWIYGAAIAVIYHYLAHNGNGLDAGDRRRFWFHTACWLVAGAGIAVTVMAGVFSGREYLGFHPAFSVILLAGWFALAWSFLKRAVVGFWRQPIYVWFWTTGILYFIYTFIEGHAYLLPWVEERPVRDIGLHWKSCGTLVGSFNFLVYGCLVYVSERVTGDKRYGQSSIAFWLFGVGCLNSFTNFAHHTYHLPQSHTVKWIAFWVSMAEVLILLKLMTDVVKAMRGQKAGGPFDSCLCYLASAKWWTIVVLFTSILLSVPNLNAIVHGTHVVTGHAMGAELGIDSLVLFASVTFLLGELYRGCPDVRGVLHCDKLKPQIGVLNTSMAVLVTWLTVSGTVHGIYRYNGEPSPAWIDWGTFMFPIFGGLLALALLHTVGRWIPLLLGVERRAAAIEAASHGASPAEG